MATINLKIEPITDISTQVSDNDYMLEFNENIEAGKVIGSLTGFLNAADRDNASFTALNGDDGGRFEIVKATSAGPGYNVGDWIVRIKNGGENYFNYENNGGFDNLFRYTSVGTNTYNVSVDVVLKDINERPKNINVTGGAVESGRAGVNIGTLSALDEDDIFWHASGETQVTYSIDAGLNGNLFTIQAGTLRLRDGTSLDYANAPKSDTNGRYYEVIVRATDGGGYDSDTGAQLPGTALSSTQTIKVYV